MLLVLAEDAVLGQADIEDQRVFVRDAVGDQAGDAVHGAGAPIVARRRIEISLKRLAPGDLAADDVARESLCRQDDVVLVADREAAARAEVDGAVEARDEIGIDREQDQAGRTAVGIAEPARHLQRQPPRGPARHGLADDQFVVGGVKLLIGVRTVADVQMRTVVVQRCRDLIAVGADQGELERLLVDQGSLSGPFAQIEIGGIVLITLAQQQQRAVEAADRVDGVVLEQPHQAVRLLQRSLDRLLALDGGNVGGDEPARGNQHDAGNSGRMQESPQPDQPFTAPDHFRLPPRQDTQHERVLSPLGGLNRGYAGTSPLGVVNSARIYGCRNQKFTTQGRRDRSRR